MNVFKAHYAEPRSIPDKKIALCRNCDHYHYIDTPSIQCFCFDENKNGYCLCENWEPHDNLEYLEFLTKKRGN